MSAPAPRTSSARSGAARCPATEPGPVTRSRHSSAGPMAPFFTGSWSRRRILRDHAGRAPVATKSRSWEPDFYGAPGRCGAGGCLGGPCASACLAGEVGQPAEGLVRLGGAPVLEVRGHPLAGDIQPHRCQAQFALDRALHPADALQLLQRDPCRLTGDPATGGDHVKLPAAPGEELVGTLRL